MKELSIEEKAKAYDEAYKVAKNIHRFSSDIAEIKRMEEIFPELKESEDEKVRKALYEYFKNRKDDGDIDETWYGISYDKILAWLEKQGEQKPAWSEEDISKIDRLIMYFKGKDNKEFTEWFTLLKDRVQPQLKQEWKQENTSDLTDFENAMMHIGGSFFGQHAGLDPNYTNAIKEQANLLLELIKKPAEWSEEDEKIYQSIMDDTVQESQLNDKQTNWLRDIKYRYFQQPKQEWSEEDERFQNVAINILNSSKVYTTSPDKYEDTINWLKSLRLRYTWKPSDEQMKALAYAVFDTQSYSYHKNLSSLEQQLKKLREE